MLLHLSLRNIFPSFNSLQYEFVVAQTLFNYLDKAFDAFYDISRLDSQDMTLNNLFFLFAYLYQLTECWVMWGFLRLSKLQAVYLK